MTTKHHHSSSDKSTKPKAHKVDKEETCDKKSSQKDKEMDAISTIAHQIADKIADKDKKKELKAAQIGSFSFQGEDGEKSKSAESET